MAGEVVQTEAEKAGLKSVAHEATRFPTGKRFDLLEPSFIEAMSRIMAVGCNKYGPNNWRKGLVGEKSGLNHAIAHLMEYMAGTPCDYGELEEHLAQASINCMFEYYFARKARLEKVKENCKAIVEGFKLEGTVQQIFPDSVINPIFKDSTQ